MKFLLLSILFSVSLCADLVLFNDGRSEEGKISWSQSGLQLNKKNLKLNDLLKLRFDRPLIANEGEYLIFKNGSVLKAQSTKLLSEEKVLLVDYRGEEKRVKLELISAISFQGAHYPQNEKPGFYTLNDFHYPGEASYFTKSSIGQTKPSKKRHKKSLLKALVLQKRVNPTSESIFRTSSREIIYGKLLKQNLDSLLIETPLGKVTYPLLEIGFLENFKNISMLKRSDIKNIKYTAFIDQCREISFNRSYTNSTITDQGFAPSRFIALQSRTEFTITAKPMVRALTFSMIMDPQSSNGHTVLSMTQNGKEIFKQPIRSGDQVSEVFIPVSQGEIKVLLDYGEGGSAGDYLILLNPQFIGGEK